jgi:DnaJ-class molecular chaperone
VDGDRELAPGDQAPSDVEGAGENVCPECEGSGRAGSGTACPSCGGTGRVVEGIGGG